MTRRTVILSAAYWDIIDSAAIISNDSDEVADRFLSAVDATFAQLAGNPGMGSELTCKNPRSII
jgi:plasmid stabilization system protein ParE